MCQQNSGEFQTVKTNSVRVSQLTLTPDYAHPQSCYFSPPERHFYEFQLNLEREKKGNLQQESYTTLHKK